MKILLRHKNNFFKIEKWHFHSSLFQGPKTPKPKWHASKSVKKSQVDV